jgi:hypothetical protein
VFTGCYESQKKMGEVENDEESRSSGMFYFSLVSIQGREGHFIVERSVSSGIREEGAFVNISSLYSEKDIGKGTWIAVTLE